MEKSPVVPKPYSPDRLQTYEEFKTEPKISPYLDKELSDADLNTMIRNLQNKRDLSKLTKDDYIRLRNIRRSRVGSELVSPKNNFKSKEHYDLNKPLSLRKRPKDLPEPEETAEVFERST